MVFKILSTEVIQSFNFTVTKWSIPKILTPINKDDFFQENLQNSPEAPAVNYDSPQHSPTTAPHAHQPYNPTDPQTDSIPPSQSSLAPHHLIQPHHHQHPLKTTTYTKTTHQNPPRTTPQIRNTPASRMTAAKSHNFRCVQAAGGSMYNNEACIAEKLSGRPLLHRTTSKVSRWTISCVCVRTPNKCTNYKRMWYTGSGVV